MAKPTVRAGDIVCPVYDGRPDTSDLGRILRDEDGLVVAWSDGHVDELYEHRLFPLERPDSWSDAQNAEAMDLADARWAAMTSGVARG